MRLVEVVMLMGAHCVSPVEHSQMMTDAAKVQCAVVIEKDTDKGTMTVTPAQAAGDPQVMAAVERFKQSPADGLTSGGTKIVPAWAPAGSPPVEIKAPTAKVTVAPEPIAPPPEAVGSTAADATDTSATDQPPQADAKTVAQPKAEPPPKQVASLATPPQKRSAAKAAAPRKPARATPAAAPKSAASCKGAAVAKWYKTADGKRKYRCVKPVSDSAPDQLY